MLGQGGAGECLQLRRLGVALAAHTQCQDRRVQHQFISCRRPRAIGDADREQGVVGKLGTGVGDPGWIAGLDHETHRLAG